MYIVKVKGSLSCLVDEKWDRLLGDASQRSHDEWQAVELCSLQSRCNATLVLVVGLQGGVAAPDAALKNHFSTDQISLLHFPDFPFSILCTFPIAIANAFSTLHPNSPSLFFLAHSFQKLLFLFNKVSFSNKNVSQKCLKKISH